MNPKKLQTPYEVMQAMLEPLDEAYQSHDKKKDGAIQLHLSYQDGVCSCYLKADAEHLTLHAGETENPTVTLRCHFFHWLDLSSKKLNPVWGMLTGKLKFKGDVSFFKALPEMDYTVTMAEKFDPPTPFEKNPSKRWTVPKSVVIINASPRAKNGYTDLFVSRFADGLKEAGANVEQVYLSQLNVKTCIGCWQCWMEEKGCVFDKADDFLPLYEKVNQADLIVYAFPLYVDGMPTILKNYFDRSVRRVYPYICTDSYKMRHPRRIEHKQQAMSVLSICGFPERSQFNALDAHFKAISHTFHIPLVSTIYRTGAMFLFNNPFYYKQQSQILEHTQNAGRELALYGKVKKQTLRKIQQQLSSHSEFAKMSDYFWDDKLRKQKNIRDY
jgi:putative NADPH-quinone reductase/putative sterol carrier protein